MAFAERLDEGGGIILVPENDEGQLERRRPALGAISQGHQVRALQFQRGMIAKERLHLPLRESKIFRSKFEQLTQFTQASDGQGQLSSSGNDEVDGFGRSMNKLVQRCQCVLIGDDVKIVEDDVNVAVEKRHLVCERGDHAIGGDQEIRPEKCHGHLSEIGQRDSQGGDEISEKGGDVVMGLVEAEPTDNLTPSLQRLIPACQQRGFAEPGRCIDDRELVLAGIVDAVDQMGAHDERVPGHGRRETGGDNRRFHG